MSIGSRIKDARKRAKLTQEQLSQRVGMKQATLSDLERGESAGTTMVASFASVLGVSAFWLETGRGSPDVSGAPAERGARMILAYPEEEDLLDLFRRTDDRGRLDILKLAAREAERLASA